MNKNFVDSALLSPMKESKIPIAKSQFEKDSMILSNFSQKPSSPDYKLVLTNKQEDDIFQKDKMYSYITIDYAYNTYYWDSFFFGTNLILISISVGSHKLNTLLYVSIIIGIFTAMLVISKKFEPFRYSEINNLMYLSYFVLITTFCCVANLTFLSSNQQIQNNLYFVITLLVNGLFYFSWLYLFILSSVFPKINENIKKLKDKVQSRKKTAAERSKIEQKIEVPTTQTKRELNTLTKRTEGDPLMINTEIMKDEGSEREKKEILTENENLNRIHQVCGDVVSLNVD